MLREANNHPVDLLVRDKDLCKESERFEWLKAPTLSHQTLPKIISNFIARVASIKVKRLTKLSVERS